MDAPKWRFNRNYGDTDQVAEFMPEFLAVRDAIVTGGKYPYNDSFLGTIPGIAGPDEGWAIYLLQKRAQLEEMGEKLAEYQANGYVPIDRVDEPTRCTGIVEYGFYAGGTGLREWLGARLVQKYGSLMVIPKGKRTSGHFLTGKVLVKVG